MKYTKKDGIYRIVLMSGAQNNILGVTFADENNIENNIEIIEWWGTSQVVDKRRVQTSKQEVLDQVTDGLQLINQSLETNYKLSKIYFSPFDSGTCSVYRLLIAKLIRHYHNGNEFKEL